MNLTRDVSMMLGCESCFFLSCVELLLDVVDVSRLQRRSWQTLKGQRFPSFGGVNTFIRTTFALIVTLARA